MFSAVWQAYRDEIVFGVAMLACSGVLGFGLVYSSTWTDLLVAIVVAALPFAAVPRLRRFVPTALLITASALVVLGAGELIYRARYFGFVAVTDFRAYSPLSVAMRPGFIRLADDPALQFTFTPGVHEIVNGDPWFINAQGFRDDEIVAAKPPGTFRILVTGDSFVMGAFVAKEDRFTDRLESMLAEGRAERFEVINFGLPAIALRDAAHLIEREAARLDADLVLATLRASQIDETLPVPAARGRLTEEELIAPDFYILRTHSFLLNIYRPAVRAAVARVSGFVRRWGSGASGAQTESVPTYPELLERMGRVGSEHQIPVAIVILRKMEFAGDTSLRAAMARAVLGDPTHKLKHEHATELARAAGIAVIDTYDAFPSNSLRSDLIVFPGDDHPRAIGHDAYARAISEWIDANAPMLGLSSR